METIKNPKVNSPNYLQMAYLCLQMDCGTYYTQEAQMSFANYLAQNNKSTATLDDLDTWKVINHINVPVPNN